jgi:hypothetical protein
MIDSDDPLYDFVDIGRIIYNDETSHYNKKGKIIFTDLDPIPISRNILNASVTLQDEILFWDNNDIKMAVNREMRKEERIKSEKDSFINLTKKINIKLNNLNSNESIKFNEMVITNNSIEYQKQKITADIANLSSILIKEAARLVAIDNINFDALSELFFLKISQSQIPVSGIIGNVSFCLNPTTSTNTAGTSVTRYNINNKRINKNEIEECLRRALCYQTQLDYDYFIDSVNKCSLKVHNLLQLGIDITVYDDFDNITYNVKFPIDRKNRKNYIVINNEEYQIKNTNKFLTLQNTSKRIPLLVLVEKLLDNKIVKDVTINNIKNIIKQGRRTYEEAIEKSNQLLEETLKLFNLKEETKHIANATRTGYLIKGKLREYFLEVQNDDSHTGNCGVYDTKSEKYICIVDKSTSQVGMDKIVNRIYALHNDNLLASKITTL